MSTHDEEATLGKAYDARLMRRLWTYVGPHRGLVALALVLIFVVSAVQLVQPYLVKVVIDDHISTGELDGLMWPVLLFFLSLLAEFAFRYAQLYTLERLGQNVVLDLRMAVFEHLQHLPSSFFDRNPVGRLMTRLTSDVEALNEAFTSGAVMMLADLVKLVGIVAILLWMDWRLALVTFAIIPPTLMLTWYFRKRMRDTYREVRGLVAKLNGFLQEMVVGMRVVQVFLRERDTDERFGKINGDHRRAQLKAVRYDSIFSAMAELVGSVTMATIVWFGGFGILRGWISFGTLVAFTEYAARFFQPVQELSQRYTVMQSAMAASERLFELLDTEIVIRSPEDPVPIRGKLRGEIVFDGVTFGYDPELPVLKDVSFRVAPGETIGVVGWTGSGKSTLIRLLARLYDSQQGSIALDGIDIRSVSLQELRRSVGIVFQDHYLFAGSVAANIGLGDPAIDRQRIENAARAVDAEGFIKRLPAGFDEEVRERGSNFSVGEKQLLSFARAIAFDPPVLVLDEATASVDPRTEATIRQALSKLLVGRTSIVIAHRLATIRDADRILVMHHGELVEEGTHDELVRIPGGIYQKLHRLQQAGAA